MTNKQQLHIVNALALMKPSYEPFRVMKSQLDEGKELSKRQLRLLDNWLENEKTLSKAKPFYIATDHYGSLTWFDKKDVNIICDEF